MKEAKFKNYDDLPLMLSVPDLTEALGISRAGAYELVKSEGFPSLHIGNRIPRMVYRRVTHLTWSWKRAI